MIQQHWRSFLLIGVLSAALFVFYVQSTKVSLTQLYQEESITSDIIAQNVTIAAEMNSLLHGHLNNYDSLIQNVVILESLQHNLNKEIVDIPALQPYLDDLNQKLDSQLEPLERFKMQLALYRNSMRHLPLLMHETEREYPEYAGFNVIYTNLIVMLDRPEEFDIPIFQRYLSSVREPMLASLIAHVQQILINYTDVITTKSTVTDSGANEAAKVLSSAYQQWFQAKIAKVKVYKALLLFSSILLLIYIGYILWRLTQSAMALREANTFLHYLQKSLDEHAIVTIANKDGNITYANDKFSQISGYSQEDVLGKNHRILKSGEHSDAFFDKMWAKISKGEVWHGVIKNIKKDGGYYWVNSTIVPFLNEEGEIWQYVSVRTDVTRQVATAKRLRESRTHYKVLSDMIPYALAVVADNQWVYANKSAVKMFGTESAKGLLHRKLHEFVVASSDGVLIAQLQQALQQQTPMLMQECKLTTLHGEIFDAELQAAPITWDGTPALLLAMHDISFRKQEEAEREQYKSQLEHTQRLESLGILAGGIAHDFNNILTSIMGNTALAMKHTEQPDALEQDLDKVSKASIRAAELCEQMLIYSGGGIAEKKIVLLTDLLDDVTSMVRTTLRDQVQLREIIAPSLPPIEADIRQMQQVVLNLLTNAAEAIENQGVITAELGIITIDESFALPLVNEQKLALGQYVFFAVSDTGCGMDTQTLGKIFDPFFTTKFTGRGLGMSAIIGIVQTHQGGITIQSEVGVGTSIRIFFPASSDKVAENVVATDEASLSPMLGTILVIDDEPGIIDYIGAVLRGAGFDVVTAQDGEEGIAVYEKHKDDLSLVISDMVMPKLGGLDVAKHIHQHVPNLPVLLSSGYNEDALSKEDSEEIAGFIQKPFLPKTLLAQVSQALDKASKRC